MNSFEKDEIIREIREGYIVFCAYLIDKTWWDEFWQKITVSNNLPDLPPIDNTSLM